MVTLIMSKHSKFHLRIYEQLKFKAVERFDREKTEKIGFRNRK
jgi:hypothetical protein